MGHTKPNKQQHPTKEQLLELQKQQAEVNRKRRKAATELYPLLLAHSKSVEDAKLLCQILAAGLRQGFGNLMREKTVADINLNDKLNQKDPRFSFFEQLLAMFATENLAAALEILEGMPQLLDGAVTEEMTKRELKDLQVTFLGDIPANPPTA